ncbi:MAG: DUF6265 family protein [Pseudomonadota bacterium]
MQATLNDLLWMCGAWIGALGPQAITEDWSDPSGGTMSTMVRLSSPSETLMIELISIREEGDSLILHLRQFTPALQPVLQQDMPLHALTQDSVEFIAPAGSGISKLAYRRVSATQMHVDVTTADGTVLTAELARPNNR